ncbi:hypothetical protein CDIK_4488 [Cucumispora dikerogammari]|nr:hypothetical protein CDIK_4488 [Cucumispora dikerogammari]
MNTIYSCEAIYARVKIAEVSDIILQSELTDNTSLNNLISLIKRDYEQDVKYITAQKALNSYKLKNKIILNNSYTYINGLISSLKDESAQAVLELDNNSF